MFGCAFWLYSRFGCGIAVLCGVLMLVRDGKGGMCIFGGRNARAWDNQLSKEVFHYIQVHLGTLSAYWVH